MRRLGVIALALVSACSVTSDNPAGSPSTEETVVPSPSGEVDATTTTSGGADGTYPPAPDVPPGPLDPIVEAALESLVDSAISSSFDREHLDTVVEGGDPRPGWILADLLRFFQRGDIKNDLVSASSDLLGIEPTPSGVVDFVWVSNHLMAWDLPAWDGYRELKSLIYPRVDSRWGTFFDDDRGIDWRLVTWGGVLMDVRPLGDNGPCNCIPALDAPQTTGAEDGEWYDDDRTVFGVVVGNEALALPKHQMEVHEMVNLTLGGRELGIPYCTLCGSAQAYFTDNVEGFDRVVLRTSGLLLRSNKLMYDLTTRSAINTFSGEALSGPLGEAGVVLEQTTVVASTWGDWKTAHPDTRILAEDGGIGRFYSEDPLGGRDDAGPIFPIGEVDPRLPAQDNVVGVITPDGTPIAFPVDTARDTLARGDELQFGGVTVRYGDGVRVFDSRGEELPTHQAFWFAWSQFHPETVVWAP